MIAGLRFLSMISFWAFGAGINFIASVALGLLVYFRDRRNEKHISFGLFTLSVGAWSLCYFLWQISHARAEALFWCRALMAGAVFIPICYLHHILSFLNRAKKFRWLIVASYVLAGILSYFCFTKLAVLNVRPRMLFRYWPTAGEIFLPILLIWLFYAGWSVVELLRAMLDPADQNRRRQAGYLLLATVIGWGGAATNYPLWFNIQVLPVGNIFISLYIVIVAYAIIRYRMLDLRIAFTRAGIFVVVYALVLGLPYLLIYKYPKEHLWALTAMAFLATVGPFIYFYLNRKAEEKLLKEQRRYQATLIQASAGMGRIKDLRKLLKLIVRILTRAVRVEHSAVYVFDKARQTYLLGAVLSSRDPAAVPETFPVNLALAEALIKTRKPVVADEERKKWEDLGKKDESLICRELSALRGELVVPSMIENRLVGFVVLGQKRSGKVFSTDELSVFTILANQAALAIENALFYDDVKRTQEQLFKAEKMATIGTMADGLSHQINNRLHAMGFIAGDMQDTLAIKRQLFDTPALKEIEQELTYALTRLQDNVARGGEVVQGLMKYTRKGGEGQAPCDIDKVFNAAYEMVQFKIKVGQMKILKAYDIPSIPMVHGNFTQLQEVFFNLIDNAYDAMMQRKTEGKDPDYKAVLSVNILPVGEQVRIIFADNGIGVKDQDRHKLFTPFFTTKASAKKGTGLGLYVIRKIIEELHGGRVEVESTYLSGTTMTLTLAVAKELM
ncbi:MAG: GAF domain-containing protein [Candidatus Omnitrophica bacterium]|nr:GAF domain-containing protein [Candidatus Omnitrophota bacterium]